MFPLLRWYVTHTGLPGSRRNFSWTKRGPARAMAMTLVQAWSWENELEGTTCPLPKGLFELLRA